MFERGSFSAPLVAFGLLSACSPSTVSPERHAMSSASSALCAAPYEMRGQFVQPILDAVEEARGAHLSDISERIMGCPDAEVDMAITVSQERVLRSPYTTLDAEKGRAETLDILLSSRSKVDERRSYASNGFI